MLWIFFTVCHWFTCWIFRLIQYPVLSDFLKLHFSDESRLLLPEDYVGYTDNTDHTPTSSAESEIDKLFCPGKVLHLVERYKLCKSELCI